MFKRYLISLLSVCLFLPVWAESDVESYEVVGADTIMVEVNEDPEWYVPPITSEMNRAPRRAVAASTCPVDSVRTFDTDSILTEVTRYDYDKAGRVICTTIWICNADGSRVGKSKTEAVYDAAGTQVLSATYDWDVTKNDWKGLSRIEDVFNEKGKQESRTEYDWVNNDWLYKTAKTYAYDASDNVTEYFSYTRDANNLLTLSAGRIRKYDTSGQTTLDIQYSAYNNNEPSAGTKKEYAYSATSKQIEYTYYSSYSNGSWIGSTHETWSYDANDQNTYHKKEMWSSGEWKINNEDYWTYNSDGNITGVEKYILKNGSLAGSLKEEYTFLYGTQVQKISFTWESGVWKYKLKAITMVDEDDNTTESCSYNWKNDAWVGTGTRTLNTYSSGKLTEQITQKWPTNATDWVNGTRLVNKYSDKNITQVASYVWENDDWKGETRTDYHYTSNQNDTIWTYTFDTDWVYSERKVYTYSGSTKIMTHNASWNGTKWVMTSMERTDIVTENGKTILNTQWTCSSDSVWVGVQRDSTAYSETNGKQIYTERFAYDKDAQSWKHSTKTETEYDSKDRQTDKRVYKWATTTDSWEGTSRSEVVYDANGNKLIDATYNGWIAATNSWKGYKKTEKTFNNDNLISSMTLSNWSTTTNDWLPASRYSYEYDGSKREVGQVVESYTDGAWINANKYIKEYKGNTKVKDNKYIWLSDTWIFTSRSETYYDDSLDRIRREIKGTWNNYGVVQSFSDNLYSFSCDLFTVQFKNYDGTPLGSIEIENGQIPEYTGETPTKPANAQYTYTFKGWDPVVRKVTGNAVYTADFDSVVNHYLIIFENEDGKVLDGRNWDYGDMPSFVGETPRKAEDEDYTYAFKGWSPEIESVTAEATYTAEFTATPKVPTAIENNTESANSQTFKYLRDGQLFIFRNDEIYNVQGIRVE